MNKLAVLLVNKACWLQFLTGPFCGVLYGVFSFKVYLAEMQDAACYFTEEVLDCTQECHLMLVIMALRCWPRYFVGVQSVHSPDNLQHFRSEWKLGGPSAQGGFVTWVLHLDPQISFCCFVSSCFSFKLQALPSNWMWKHHRVFFSPPPFHPYLGDHEIFSSPSLLWVVTEGSIQWENGCN